MPTGIEGLHHVTAMAKDARINNAFFTRTLGLRRVKKTVNFDAPDVYHLYYGDRTGTPGTIMTHFPFPDIAPGRPGTGEVARTAFSVPHGSLAWWEERLTQAGVKSLSREIRFGEDRLLFSAPEGDRMALVESDDKREPWAGGEVGKDAAVRGFHSVSLRLSDAGPTGELLGLMGYERREADANSTRFALPDGNGADIVDIETDPTALPARLGAGSVHHVAFAVADRAAQAAVRQTLVEAGFQTTPSIDRDYFWAIYFRTPGGVLFEIATAEPGFARDEAVEHLGQQLRLPSQHAHLRGHLERHLQPLEG